MCGPGRRCFTHEVAACRRELALQLLSIAEISRTAGFAPHVPAEASPRDVELLHEVAAPVGALLCGPAKHVLSIRFGQSPVGA